MTTQVSKPKIHAGPWKVATYKLPCPTCNAAKASYAIVGGDGSGATIAVTTCGWSREQEGHARLIAAAPTLLEALLALTSSRFVSYHNYEGDNLLEQARTAIAQALGEEVKA